MMKECVLPLIISGGSTGATLKRRRGHLTVM